MQLDALNEITIAEIHRRYRDGSLTAVQLVQWYLDRIEALDRAGPKINAIISLNPDILSQARACRARSRTRLPSPLRTPSAPRSPPRGLAARRTSVPCPLAQTAQEPRGIALTLSLDKARSSDLFRKESDDKVSLMCC